MELQYKTMKSNVPSVQALLKSRFKFKRYCMYENENRIWPFELASNNLYWPAWQQRVSLIDACDRVEQLKTLFYTYL